MILTGGETGALLACLLQLVAHWTIHLQLYRYSWAGSGSDKNELHASPIGAEKWHALQEHTKGLNAIACPPAIPCLAPVH